MNTIRRLLVHTPRLQRALVWSTFCCFTLRDALATARALEADERARDYSATT